MQVEAMHSAVIGSVWAVILSTFQFLDESDMPRRESGKSFRSEHASVFSHHAALASPAVPAKTSKVVGGSQHAAALGVESFD